MGTVGVAVYCPACGSKMVGSPGFCSACGTAIDLEPLTAPAPISIPAPSGDNVASEEQPIEGAAPVEAEAASSGRRLSRFWLIGAAAAVFVSLVAAGLFVWGLDRSDTVTVTSGTLPVASSQEGPGTGDEVPDVAEQEVSIDNTGGEDDGNPGTSSTTTTAMLSANSVPVLDLENLQWARVPHDEAVFGGPSSQRMTSVVAAGAGLVAVGSDWSGGDEDAAVWWSVDGVAWNRVPHDETVFGGPDAQRMNSVVAAGPGLVAVGSDSSGGIRDTNAAVWWSVDGLTWNRVPHDEAVFGGTTSSSILSSMYSVVAAGPGLVAVGIEGTRAAVWWSVDGLTWIRVPPDEPMSDDAAIEWMSSVAAAGPGLVAVGWDLGKNSDQDAAVWWSIDGLTWNRVPHDEAVFGGPNAQAIGAVVAAGPGLVAVGSDWSEEDGWDAAVWWSVDGLTWNRVPDYEAVFGGPNAQVMWSVTAAGPGLVAVGSEWSGDGDGDAAVWWSIDGLTWNRIPHDEAVFSGPGSQEMRSLVVAGPGLVAVGVEVLEGDADAAVWVAEPLATDPDISAASPWLITPNSVGPVTLGAPVADLNNLTGVRWDFREPAAPGCVIGSLASGGVSIQGFETVSHIVVRQRGIARTQEGVQVGDHQSFVLEAFGDRASVEQGYALEPIILVDGPASEDYSYVLYLNDDDVVVAIYVADGPGLIDEGCA